jgi:hypothetical protein
MRSARYLAHALIALLLLVPAATRAYQRLDHRADLKPAPSFRDVDRPPDPDRGALDAATAVVACEPDRVELGLVDPLAPPLPPAADGERPESLRAPPRSA